MRFTDCNRVAFGAVARYPMRTGMMLLATSIGVSAVLLLTSLGESARGYVSGAFQELGTNIVIVIPGKTETTGIGVGMRAGATARDLTLYDSRALKRSHAIAQISPLIIGVVSVSRAGQGR